MPTITPLLFDPKFISLSIERHAKRSPGIHLSTIIRDRLVTAGVKRQATKPMTEAEQHITFEKGFLWENMVIEYLTLPEYKQYEWDQFVSLGLQSQLDHEAEISKGALIRPGEQRIDGIYLTPDAINVRLWFYEEWKATAISPKNLNDSNIGQKKLEWIWQGAANCKVFKMTRVMLRVWHHCQFVPDIRQYVVDFTKEEVDENWRQLLEHYQYMLERDNVKL